MDKKNVKLVEEDKYLIKRFPSHIIDISKIKVAEALGIIADVGLVHWVYEDSGFYDRLSGNETIFEFMALSAKAIYGVITGEFHVEKTEKLIRYAESDSPIIIVGETGTGKELLANAIVQLSNRKKCPFIQINSAELSESLFESEMFGHKKGAFTGATSEKKGLLLSADKGTFFLDELGKMPEVLQAKLLRVIQNKQIRMVGDDKFTDIDIRFIVALQQHELMKVLPDLRARLKYPDVILLPNLNQQLKKYGKFIIYSSLNKISDELNFPKNEPWEIMDDLMNFLLKHNYKLNFRELENILHHAIMNRSHKTPNCLTLSSLSGIKDILLQNDDYQTEILSDSRLDRPNSEVKLSEVLNENNSLEPLFYENDTVTMNLDYHNIKFTEVDSLIKKFGSLIAKGMILHIRNSGVDFKKAFFASKSAVGYEGHMQKIARIIGMNVNTFLKINSQNRSIVINQLHVKDSDVTSKSSEDKAEMGRSLIERDGEAVDKINADQLDHSADLINHFVEDSKGDSNINEMAVDEKPALPNDVLALFNAVLEGKIDLLKQVIDNGADVNAKMSDDFTALYLATEKGYSDIVEQLLINGADVNAKRSNEYTALHLAAQEGHTDIISLLINNGVDVSAKLSNECTALHIASEKGHTDIVYQLLINGADVNEKGLEDCTALHLAAQEGCTDTISLLINNGAEINAKISNKCTALHLAAEKGYSDIVEQLLINGADVNAKGIEDYTALHIATEKGHDDIVSLLINNGVDVNAKLSNECTALHLAADKGHTDIVNHLIDNGADVNAKGIEDYTALHFAANEGTTDIVSLLINNGAEINVKISDKGTALHLAADKGHDDIVCQLLINGADVNAKGIVDVTALHLAAKKGHDGIVNHLIANGADVNAKTSNDILALLVAARIDDSSNIIGLLSRFMNIDESEGATVLSGAVYNGHVDIVKQLLDSGADANAKGVLNLTALHHASTQGHVEVVGHLINNGADVNAKTSEGLTPLMFATGNGYSKIIDQLIAKGADGFAVTDDGRSASDIAIERGDEKIFNLLESKGAKLMKYNFSDLFSTPFNTYRSRINES